MRDLTRELGDPVYERIDAPATPEQKAALGRLTPQRPGHHRARRRAGHRHAHRGARQRRPIGGIKVVTAHGWFAARPSGTEDVYKLYAESFKGPEHLRAIQAEAQAAIQAVFDTTTSGLTHQ